MRNRISLAILFLIVFGAATASAQSNTSVYTNLSGFQCKTLENRPNAGFYQAECPGAAGYKLLVHESLMRQNILVFTPKGERQSLELRKLVGGFLSLANEAEWRMKASGAKAAPVGLIVGYHVSNPKDSTKGISWLAVVRITADAKQICVTDAIPPGPDQNAKAREVADTSASRHCMTSN